MNLFVKKLLAKYVIYIEIIGYLLVFLFIAGLVALSFIKAEDEYVNLTGAYEIKSHQISFEKRNYIIDLLSEPDSLLRANSPLMEITDDEKFIADQIIFNHLEVQLEEARKASAKTIERQLSSIMDKIERELYPRLNLKVIRTPVEGRFLLLEHDDDLIPENKIIGGVYDFENSIIRVTQFPADNRIKKKLKPDQSGSAILQLNVNETAQVPISLTVVDKNEAVFDVGQISRENMYKIAEHLSSGDDDAIINANINLLVGSKSWMRLIWR
jgi:hypothetical protein